MQEAIKKVWSLLIPGMETEADSGAWSVMPAAVGFLLGIGFLLLIDELTPHIGTDKPECIRSHLSKTAMLALAVTIHNLPEGMGPLAWCLLERKTALHTYR